MPCTANHHLFVTAQVQQMCGMLQPHDVDPSIPLEATDSAGQDGHSVQGAGHLDAGI